MTQLYRRFYNSMILHKTILPLTFSIIFSTSIFAQTNTASNLIHQNRVRGFIVRTPPAYDGETALPVVMVLHGGGGSAQATISFTQMHLVADTANFIAVFPQGAGPSGDGFTWADGRGTSADRLNIDDVGFIDKLIDKLDEDFAVDLDRIYATGFSNGGFMCQRLACELSDRLAAVASGGATMGEELFDSCQPTRPLPMLYMNGTADSFVPFAGGSVGFAPGLSVATDSLMQFWSEHNNCQTTLDSVPFPDLVPGENSSVTRFQFTDCDCNTDVVLYKVYGGGHTWPGVVAPIFEQIGGQTNEDIHGSVEIWNFFKNYTLSCLTTSTEEEIIEKSDWSIFPNPVFDQITINNITPPFTYRILSVDGQILFSQKDHNDVSLKIESLNSGLYFLELLKGKERKTLKVMKL